jgi:signal transduction histidine kinase/ActR/RegA family two-component response regulator
MGKINLKRWLTLNPAIAVVALLAIVVVCLYAFYMREAFFVQIEQTIAENTRKEASEIETKLRFARSGIQHISQMVARKMDGPVLQYPNSVIHPLLTETPFSRVEYIRGDGINMVNGEPAFDASDREYFRRGILGETGIWINYSPRYSKEALVDVYTPLIYNDSVVGVLTGLLGGNTDLRPVLDYRIFGENTVGILCDQHLNIIVSNVVDNDFGKSFESRATEFFPSDVVELFKQNAMLDEPKAFRFSSDAGTSVACVFQVGGTGWFVVQMVPCHVLMNYSRWTALSAAAAVLIVALLFAVYMHSAYRTNRRQQTENDGRRLNIINALTESYGSAFEVDLNTGRVVVYRLNPNVARLMREFDNQDLFYDQLLAHYIKRAVLPEDYAVLGPVITLDVLRREFIKRDRFELVYRVLVNGGIHYLQVHYVKPSRDRSEFVVGFKNIDEAMTAELEKRKELNEQRMELVRALEQAHQADAAKSKFLFNMSHDICIPMNAVLGYGNLSKKRLARMSLPAEEMSVIGHYLDNIQMAGTQLLDMIQSVLNKARIDSGAEVLNETPVLTVKMSDWLVATFEQAALQKNVLLQVSRNFEHNCVVADKVKIQQILLNVVSNAIKFTKEWGLIRISLRDLPHEMPGMCYIEMVVEDTGIGISEEFMPRIFNDFEREQTARTRGISGVGLGLSIVKKLVDLMQGTIEVTSRVGEGTRVVVKTPHAIAEWDSASRNDLMAKLPENFAGKRVLLVDDDSMNCEIVGDMLKEWKMDYACVVDGSSCIHKLEFSPSGTFDVVLLNLQLSILDGYDVVRHIRKMENGQKANIPVIAMAACTDDVDREKMISVGINGFLTKPIEAEQLKEALAKTFI